MVHPPKISNYDFFSYKSPKGDQAGISLDFDKVWVGKIWCFIQNLHDG